jgi:hypothetical protein
MPNHLSSCRRKRQLSRFHNHIAAGTPGNSAPLPHPPLAHCYIPFIISDSTILFPTRHRLVFEYDRNGFMIVGIVRQHLPFRVIIPAENNYMKQFLLLVLAVVGLVALIPTQSKAQVTISVGPGYSNGYYSNGYYYQGQPYYYRHHANRYHTYYHNERYYRSHQWHNND